MTRTTFVTDSDPIADALARWLSTKIKDTAILTTTNRHDLKGVVLKRIGAGLSEHLVVLVAPTHGHPQTTAGDALAVAHQWLADLSPMHVRTRGVQRIADRVNARDEGFEALMRFAHQLTPVAASVTGPKTKRGRPKGRNPFSGAGFGICVTLLLHPAQHWTERALALRAQRPPAVVHRVLTELAQRGYLRRTRGATAVLDPRVLRDDVLAAWRAKVGVPRQHVTRLLAPSRMPLGKAVQRAAAEAGAHPLLAGWSAIDGPEALVDQPLCLYALPAFVEALRSLGFEDYAGARASVVVWEAPEPAVYAEPRILKAGLATNAIVTYLDVAFEGGSRNEAALHALWREATDGAVA